MNKLTKALMSHSKFLCKLSGDSAKTPMLIISHYGEHDWHDSLSDILNLNYSYKNLFT
jgi:hypothetical protein